MTERRANPDIAWRAWRSTILFTAVLCAVIMVTAGTFAYWQGWLLWAQMGTWSAFTTWYFLKRDPALVERRLRAGPAAEREPAQKRIQLFISVALCAMLVVSVLDWRLGWSAVAWQVVLAGNVLVALAYLLILVVLRENSFASATVGVEAGQAVVSSGPYAIVRHPMYSAALVLFAAPPLALGSWWGVLLVLPLAAGLVSRLLHEEAFLARNLPGYEAYRHTVRWRLVPGVW